MNVYQLSAKNCMSHLLLKDTFDTFLFIEGEFTTFNKFTISGYLQEDFFDEKLEETYSRLPPGRHSGTLPQFPLRWKHPPMHHRHFPQNLFYG